MRLEYQKYRMEFRDGGGGNQKERTGVILQLDAFVCHSKNQYSD